MTEIETTVTSYLCASPASDALSFYAAAFGAVEDYRIDYNGGIGHAEFKIGATRLCLSDEAPELGVLAPSKATGSPCALILAVPDADAAWSRALAAGATVDRPLRDEPYGRSGWLKDPFGYRWNITTPNPNFHPDQMK